MNGKILVEYYLLERSIKTIRVFPSQDMTDPNYIRKYFRLIKIIQKRLDNIEKRIQKLKKEKTPDPDNYFEYLCNLYKHEKTLLKNAQNNSLHNINLTG